MQKAREGALSSQNPMAPSARAAMPRGTAACNRFSPAGMHDSGSRVQDVAAGVSGQGLGWLHTAPAPHQVLVLGFLGPVKPSARQLGQQLLQMLWRVLRCTACETASTSMSAHGHAVLAYPQEWGCKAAPISFPAESSSSSLQA